jgi:putative DNA primase/helicase
MRNTNKRATPRNHVPEANHEITGAVLAAQLQEADYFDALYGDDAAPVTPEAAQGGAKPVAALPDALAGVSFPSITYAFAQTCKLTSRMSTKRIDDLAKLINAIKPVPQSKVDALVAQGLTGKELNNAIKVEGVILHFGDYPEGVAKRELKNINASTGAAFDYDFSGGDRVRRSDALAAAESLGMACIAWDTYSSGLAEGDDGMTFRIVFPFTESQPIDTHGGRVAAIAKHLGIKAPGANLSVAQGFFVQPRIGRSANAVALPGVCAEQLIDFSELEATANEIGPVGGFQDNGTYDPLDHALNTEEKALYLRCLPSINPYSEERGHWIGVIGAGLRGFGFDAKVLTHPDQQNDEQKQVLIALDEWCKAEHPPEGAKPKYTPGCVVRDGRKLFNGSAKMAGLHAVVQKAHDSCPDGIAGLLEGEPGLQELALRVLEGKPVKVEQAKQPEVSPVGSFVRWATNVDMVKVEWFWKHRLARGMFHLLGGSPATGKSTIAFSWAAIISSGGTFPDGAVAPKGKVLIWSGEDSYESTIKPRLAAAGADMRNIGFLSQPRETVKGELIEFNPAIHLPVLMQEIETLPQGEIAMLIIDPIVSMIADGDNNQTSVVRSALAPLVAMLEKLGIIGLGITHFTKGSENKDPKERFNGSSGYIALARVGFATVKDQNEEGQHLITVAKSNIGPEGGGYSYHIQQTEVTDPKVGIVETSRIIWGEVLEGDARALIHDAETVQRDRPANKLDQAKTLLRELLAQGPRFVHDIEDAAENAGIGWRTIKTAKGEIGVVSARSDPDNKRSPYHWFIDIADFAEVVNAING